MNYELGIMDLLSMFFLNLKFWDLKFVWKLVIYK